ncbi:MAG: hypothetical protein PUD47_06030 [Bacteroidales bacterium]|nr:hypothetical protein [Bacteroidales bacterium]
MKQHLKTMLLFVVAIMLSVSIFAADGEIMITRDGQFLHVKVSSITNDYITYLNVRNKKAGEVTSPIDYVYMILRDKGTSSFFDESGNQITIQKPEYDINSDELVFLNDGKILVVYNLSLTKDAIEYQLSKKKKVPYTRTPKNAVFLIKGPHDNITLLNDTYIKKHSEQYAGVTQRVVVVAKAPEVTPIQESPQAAPSPILESPVAVVPSVEGAERPLLAVESLHAPAASILFEPSPDMAPAELEHRINEINPYPLYRKGSVAEYKFQQDGKDFAYMGGPSYIQQIVSDERIENGLLVSYVSQKFFNKKHAPSKGVPAKYLGYLYPTEIDVNGSYHLTHDISEDCGYYIKERRGYAILIPAKLEIGQRLPCSTIYDNLGGALGQKMKTTRIYKDFVVEKEEQAITPAGTFDCVKLVGKVEHQGSLGNHTVQYDMWLARGIGVVRLDVTTLNEDGTKGSMYTIYLNALSLT